MTRPDDIIDLIDAGLQSSGEAGMPVGEPDACVRCGLAPLVDAELCTPCRAFLLGDSDVDPVEGSRPACGDPACTQCPRVPVPHLMEDADTCPPSQLQAALAERIAAEFRSVYESLPPVTVTGLAAQIGDLLVLNGEAFLVVDRTTSPTGITWMVRPVDQAEPVTVDGGQ